MGFNGKQFEDFRRKKEQKNYSRPFKTTQSRNYFAHELFYNQNEQAARPQTQRQLLRCLSNSTGTPEDDLIPAWLLVKSYKPFPAGQFGRDLK